MGRHGTIRRSDESEQGTTGHAGRRRALRGPATIGAGADAARPGGVARRRLSHHRHAALHVAGALHTLSTRGPDSGVRLCIAHGHGLIWNSTGAPVEGYTNVLWTLWMAGLQ